MKVFPLVFVFFQFSNGREISDLVEVVEHMAEELGGGRLAILSFIYYTADNCLQNMNVSETIGNDGLNCYSNAFKNSKSILDTLKGKKQSVLTDEQTWENLCKLWPLYSSCSRNTTVPTINQCYQHNHLDSKWKSTDARRGSEALLFTDAYISFYCANISRTVGVLETTSPRRLICYWDLKEFINDCTRVTAEAHEDANYGLQKSLNLVRDCFVKAYKINGGYCYNKNKNSDKILPFIVQMFSHIDDYLSSFEIVAQSKAISTSSTTVASVTNSKNAYESISDKYLREFLMNIIPEENTFTIPTTTEFETIAKRFTFERDQDHADPKTITSFVHSTANNANTIYQYFLPVFSLLSTNCYYSSF